MQHEQFLPRMNICESGSAFLPEMPGQTTLGLQSLAGNRPFWLRQTMLHALLMFTNRKIHKMWTYSVQQTLFVQTYITHYTWYV